jgi:hypothetical protein
VLSYAFLRVANTNVVEPRLLQTYNSSAHLAVVRVELASKREATAVPHLARAQLRARYVATSLLEFGQLCVACENPATRNRTRDHLIAATFYSQMLYQLSYSRSVDGAPAMGLESANATLRKLRLRIGSSARKAVASA